MQRTQSLKKQKIYAFLNKPYMVLLVMLTAPLFGFIDRNFVFFYGLGVVVTILWSDGYKWARFGLATKLNSKTVMKAALITIALILLDSALAIVVYSYFGEPNLSSLEGIKNDLTEYIITLVVVWVFASFGEEILFRGYYMKGLAQLMGNSNTAWITSGLIISLYFGISHFYQGVSGMIMVTIWSMIIALIFTRNRENLALLILIHGFQDTYGLTLLFLGMKDPVTIFLKGLI